MFLLVIDTSGKQGSIALARVKESPQSNKVQVIEVVPLAGGTFSAQLVPQIAALLSNHGLTRFDIGAFAVAAGPGSFTGLRVGLAAVKAFAEVLDKPIAAVSLLEVCAVASGLTGKVMVALDAGRGDVYVGEYDAAADDICTAREHMLSKEEFLSQARGWTVVTPDSPLAEASKAAGLDTVLIASVSASSLAELGWRKIQAGDTVTSESLEANYIRRTDAEIAAKD